MLHPYIDVALWLIAIELIGLATLPLALRVLSALPDRGYAASKMLGLILLAWAAWFTAILGLTAFTGATIVVLGAALGIVGWWRWGAAVLGSWREARALAMGAEATFLLGFVVAAWVRSYNAAIAGQEKQMDFTFLHSLIRAETLPAEDLWFAGYGTPYYYFGYLIQSLVAKVVPVDPAVAYNLAVAMVLALSASLAFGLAASLIRLAGGGRAAALSAGAFGAFALTVMGNLEAFFELVAAKGVGDEGFWSAVGIKGLQAHSQGFPPTDGVWWFRAARVIPNIQPDGITEFPYFSFLLGDLHPHYMAIPLGILIATFAAQELAVSQGSGVGGLGSGAGRWTLGIETFARAIVLGAVIPSNTWDLPVFWGVFALASIAAALGGQGPAPLAVLLRVRDLAAVAVLAALCYAPYFVGYVAQPLGMGLVDERTYFGSLFVLFGPLLVLPLAAGAIGVFAAAVGGRGLGAGGLPWGSWPLAVGLAAAAALVLVREPTLGFLLLALSLWLPLAWTRARSGTSASATAAAVMTTVGLGSILVAEVVFLRDVFGTRMNTVFKFYYDAWILLALAAPLLAWELLVAARRGAIYGAQGAMNRAPTQPAPGSAWLAAAAAASLAATAFLALAGAIYPLAASHTKSDGFAGPATLDGMSHLRAFRPDDVAAIEWMKGLGRRAGVVEAVGHDYTDAARFSTFAGVPTLVGWVGHELQWRGPIPDIDRRQQLARRIYTDPDLSDWRGSLEPLGMEFVVVGNLEREIYGADRTARVERELPVVHRSGSTAVYSLRPRAALVSQ